MIFFDFKKLLIFEVFIRLFGLLIIFPMLKLGFYLSLKFSGLNYLANDTLSQFLSNPITVLTIFVLLLTLALYFVIEFVFLGVLFDFSYHRYLSTWKEFLLSGLNQLYKALKKYHLFIIFPIFVFFIVIEFIQIAFFASTLKVPQEISDQLKGITIVRDNYLIIFLILFVIYSLSIFVIMEYIQGKRSVKDSIKTTFSVLKGKLKFFLIKIIAINGIAHLIMFIVYSLLLVTLGQVIGFYRGQEVVFGFIITSFYSIYWIITLLFSMFLIPLNISYTIYYYNLAKEIKPNEEQVIKLKVVKSNNKKWLFRVFVLSFFLVFMLNIVTIIEEIKATDNQTQFLKQEEIIAHRGASYYAPENTISAFEMAILQGSSGVEFDIYATKDLIPVVIHDASIRRTTNETENIYVSDLTYEKLQEYDAGSWFSTDFIGELVPSFEETLQTIKGRTTGYIDIKTKNQAVEIEVLRLIEEYDMINEVKVMSFDANQLFRFKEMNSEIETVLLVGVYDLNIYNYILDERIDHVAIQIQVIKNNPDLVFVTHNQGKKVYAWGVDDRNAINIGVNADVDGFITKRPILTREIAYSKNTSDYLRRYIELLFN